MASPSPTRCSRSSAGRRCRSGWRRPCRSSPARSKCSRSCASAGMPDGRRHLVARAITPTRISRPPGSSSSSTRSSPATTSSNPKPAPRALSHGRPAARRRSRDLPCGRGFPLRRPRRPCRRHADRHGARPRPAVGRNRGALCRGDGKPPSRPRGRFSVAKCADRLPKPIAFELTTIDFGGGCVTEANPAQILPFRRHILH